MLTINGRLDELTPTETVAQLRAGLQRLSEVVSSSRASFGVRFDPVGERIRIVDEKGEMVSDERALLVVLDLVAAERKTGRVALPVTTTRVAEQVCRFHGVEVNWTPTSMDALTQAAAADDVIFAADGRGGFVVPEFARTVDGIATFARLIGLVARTRLTLSQIDARIPDAHLLKRSMPTPWAAKGSVMRTVVEAAGTREVDTTDGVRVVAPGPGLGPRAARSGRRRDAPVGGRHRRRHRPAAAGRVGPRGRASGPVTGGKSPGNERLSGRVIGCLGMARTSLTIGHPAP